MNHIAIIDNYDSFTYNLVQLVEQAGARVTVLRNDRFALPDLAAYDKLLLSPGPGIPQEAGLLMPVIRTYAATKSWASVWANRPSARLSAHGCATSPTCSTACRPKSASTVLAWPTTISSTACPAA